MKKVIICLVCICVVGLAIYGVYSLANKNKKADNTTSNTTNSAATNSTNTTNETSNSTKSNTTNTATNNASSSSAPASSASASSNANSNSKSLNEYAEEAIKEEVKANVKDLITGDVTFSNIKVYTEAEMNSNEALKNYVAEGKIAFEVDYVVTPKDENSKMQLTVGSAEEDGNKVKKHNVGTLIHSAKGTLVVEEMGTGF